MGDRTRAMRDGRRPAHVPPEEGGPATRCGWLADEGIGLCGRIAFLDAHTPDHTVPVCRRHAFQAEQGGAIVTSRFAPHIGDDEADLLLQQVYGTPSTAPRPLPAFYTRSPRGMARIVAWGILGAAVGITVAGAAFDWLRSRAHAAGMDVGSW
jgi:hypothetical protein